MIRDLITIFRREFATYFSPIGIIFMIAFLGLNGVLFMLTFSSYPAAEMRNLFDILPIVLCVFLPAVSMRLWAEDRKGNTLELLLTFPMKPVSIVLGKYLASLAFFALALLGTVTIPIMLATLGSPDYGQIVSSYMGALMLGGSFLALGLFLSGLVKDQIVAFVLGLMACFAVFLLSWNLVAASIDNYIPGLGGMLRDLVGATGHYFVFTKGVIEGVSILYFAVWTAVFLVLNGMFMELRGRSAAKATFLVAIVLCLAIGLAFNALIADTSLGRIDMTEGSIHTVSDSTAKVLAKLQVPVQVKYYVTPASEMPTELKSLERDVIDKLQAIRLASGGKIEFKAIHMRAANVFADRKPADDEKKEKSEEESLEKRMLDKGIQPFSVSAQRQTGGVTEMIYSSVGVAYKEKKEEIIPQILPQGLGELEYQLVSTVYRMTRDKPPAVALYAPLDQVSPQEAMMYRQMRRPVPPPRDNYQMLPRLLSYLKYGARRVEFKKADPLPPDYDVLIVAEPREFSERQRWEVARALAEGKRVLLAVQNRRWRYNASRDGLTIAREDIKPQINELLRHYGIEIDERILMDKSSFTIRVPRNQLEAAFGGGISLPLPFHVVTHRESYNANDALTARLPSLSMMWPSAIKLTEEKLKENALDATVLVSTSEKSWQIPPKDGMAQSDFDPPAEGQRSYPIIVRVQGQFPDVFKGKKRPEWPEEPRNPMQPPDPRANMPDLPAAPLKPAPGELILIGCSQILQDNMLRNGGNSELVISSIDYLAYGADLVAVRGKRPIDRSIAESKVTPGVKLVWSIVNSLLIGIVWILIGVTRYIIRSGSRSRYAEELARSGGLNG